MPVIIEWTPESNRPPEARNVLIRSLGTARPDYDLTLSYDYYDPDGDPEQGSLIYWYRNGARVSYYDGLLTIPYLITNTGDFWYAMVRPRDDQGMWGDWATSNVIWIVPPPVLGYRCPGVYPTRVNY